MKTYLPLVLASLALIGFSENSAAADACSGQVSGFLAGLEAADTPAARAQIADIRSLRERMTDCEVRKNIPQLVESDRALEAARNAVAEKRNK